MVKAIRREAEMMQYVSRDRNIVQYYGAAFSEAGDIMLITEFMEVRRLQTDRRTCRESRQVGLTITFVSAAAWMDRHLGRETLGGGAIGAGHPCLFMRGVMLGDCMHACMPDVLGSGFRLLATIDMHFKGGRSERRDAKWACMGLSV
jgi:hypothetical protein